MTKWFVMGLLQTFVCLPLQAQWTAKDSLNLQRMLRGEGELQLNKEAVKLIDLGKPIGKPGISSEKNWLLPDATLPTSLPEKSSIVLTLHPYTANTRFNWDPVYRKKINVNKDTWRGDPFYAMKKQISYTNDDRHPMEGTIPLGNRGVYLAGGTIGGLDLLFLFQKEFWDVKGRERRARTLEVLEAYGDSTTASWPEMIIQPKMR